MDILCINDLSCHSSCSLSIALPVLIKYEHNVSVLPTGVFSTHSGIDGYVHQSLYEFVKNTLAHWDSLGIKFDYIYSGLLIGCEQLNILELVLKEQRGVNILDPIIGDYGVLYNINDEAYVDKYRKLIKYADILTPNVTEAAILCGHKPKPKYSKTDIEKFIIKLKDMGGKTIIVKSVDFDDGKIGVAINHDDKTKYIFHNKQNGEYSGCGDLFASIIVGEIASGKDLYLSVKNACEMVQKAIEITNIKSSKTETECTNYTKKDFGIAFEKIINCL